MKSRLTTIKKRILPLLAATVVVLCASPSMGVNPEPIDFVIHKAVAHDVLFLGTQHQRVPILNFIARLLPRLASAGITHVGLEITSDQQQRLDRYLQTGQGGEQIEVFEGIDCPAYRRLLRILGATGIQALALDLPRDQWDTPITRDQWMAARIQTLFTRHPGARMLVIVGNLHTIKQVEWLSPAVKGSVVRDYLHRLNPDLRLYSIAECVQAPRNVCGLDRGVVQGQAPVAIETRNLDVTPGLMRLLAAKPMTAAQLLDAMILF